MNVHSYKKFNDPSTYRLGYDFKFILSSSDALFPHSFLQVAFKKMDNNNLLKQLLMLGVGTTSLVAEKLREVSDQWVNDGKLDPDQATAFINDMMQQLKSEQGNFETQMQRQLKNVLQDLGVPRQNEMDELRGRLDRLERQMRDLENRQWR